MGRQGGKQDDVTIFVARISTTESVADLKAGEVEEAKRKPFEKTAVFYNELPLVKYAKKCVMDRKDGRQWGPEVKADLKSGFATFFSASGNIL